MGDWSLGRFLFVPLLLLGWLGAGCTRDKSSDAPPVPPPPAPAAASQRLALPSGPSKLESVEVSGSLKIELPPAGTVVHVAGGEAELDLEGIKLSLRRVSAEDPVTRPDYWINAVRVMPTFNEPDPGGWILIGEVEGGRKLIGYRKALGVLCETGIVADKRGTLWAAKSCLSLTPQ